MEQLEYNSGNEKKRIKKTNTPEILQQMDTWMNEIETNNVIISEQLIITKQNKSNKIKTTTNKKNMVG